MTRTKEQIEAEIAALREVERLMPGSHNFKPAIAQREAELAKVDAEPDWGPAVERFAEAAGFECGNLPEVLESIRAGLIAAAPLMPTAAMTDAEIEELAGDMVEKHVTGSDNFCEQSREFAELTIRATIARLGHGRKAWPSEAELREMANSIREDMWADRLKHGNSSFADAALEMARRLREFGA